MPPDSRLIPSLLIVTMMMVDTTNANPYFYNIRNESSLLNSAKVQNSAESSNLPNVDIRRPSTIKERRPISRLYNRCSRRFVQIEAFPGRRNRHGRPLLGVDANAPRHARNAELHLIPTKWGFKIRSAHHRGYVCLNKRHRLTIRRNAGSPRCKWNVATTFDGFHQFRSVHNPELKLGFNYDGAALKPEGHTWRMQKCFQFQRKTTRARLTAEWRFSQSDRKSRKRYRHRNTTFPLTSSTTAPTSTSPRRRPDVAPLESFHRSAALDRITHPLAKPGKRVSSRLWNMAEKTTSRSSPELNSTTKISDGFWGEIHDGERGIVDKILHPVVVAETIFNMTAFQAYLESSAKKLREEHKEAKRKVWNEF